MSLSIITYFDGLIINYLKLIDKKLSNDIFSALLPSKLSSEFLLFLSDEELDLELLSNANHVHRKSSPLPNEDPVEPPPYQEIHSNGFAHKFDPVNKKLLLKFGL